MLTVANLPSLVAAFVLVKLLHELAHGTACRRFGGECHELGLLFVACIPLAYCDVSDAWLFRERWKRVIVSAAGVLVELMVAAVFAVLWAASVPSVLHVFFLNVAVVASVNTLLVNANPLLRYDGYYVMADLIGRPNLAAESRRAAAYFFDRAVLGLSRERVAQSAAAEVGLIAFGAASFLYRLFVVGLILWVVATALEPYGLERVAHGLGIATVLAMTIAAGNGIRSRLRATREGQDSSVRAIIGISAFSAGVLALLLIPFPRTVVAPLTVTPGTSRPVYVTEPGRLVMTAPEGSRVSSGDVIARLGNVDLMLQVAAAEGELRVQEETLQQLINRRSTDAGTAQSIPTVREAVAAARSRLETLKQRQEQLTILADRDGFVLPPRNGTSASLQVGRYGTPLDEASVGAWLEPQTLICWVGDEADVRLVATVEETSIPLVREASASDVSFSSHPTETFAASVEAIDASPVDDVDRELVVAGMIASPDRNAIETASNQYLVRLVIDDTSGRGRDTATLPSPLYSTGTTRIHCEPANLLTRLWRLICHTFAIQIL